jgi:Lhr-like helicase
VGGGRAGRPLGFVANEYALAVWGLGDTGFAVRRGQLSLQALFDEDMLGDDLEAWLAESALMKRTFRACAIIPGLIERRFPGEEKSRRQLTVSTDLVYDVLRRHQGDHVLLRAARADAATVFLDIRRVGEALSRIRGRIVHQALDRVGRWRCRRCWRWARSGLRRGRGGVAAVSRRRSSRAGNGARVKTPCGPRGELLLKLQNP